MCIIAAKPAGVEVPSYDTLRTMWNANNDGAGFMYVENGAVRIEKGFMKYKNFIKALDKVRDRLDLTASAMVFHFRITTHGGTKPENCHPFPISDNAGVLSKRKCSVDLGVAHNGIIYSVDPRKGVSDTMEYIMTQLAPLKRAVPDFYKSKDLRLMIENAIDSKMAFLTKENRIYTIGDFVEDNGMLYSNYSYVKYASRYYGMYDWDDYYNDCGWSYYSGKTTENTKTDTAKPDANDDTEVSGAIFGAFLHEDDYVMSDDGRMLEAYDFLLAEDGISVYQYDYESDSAVYRPGYMAFSCTGVRATYNADEEGIFYVK